MTLHIQRAPALSTVSSLLKAADLPTEDITVDLLTHFLYAAIDNEPVGVIGAVPCGGDALVRSLVVAAAHRGKGLGSRLVAAAESHAQDQGACGLYLLTLTAEGFFRGHGYQPVAREKAPAAIRSTAEFSHICPVSSVFMFKPLKDRQAPSEGR